jgi:hypothetical protein
LGIFTVLYDQIPDMKNIRYYFLVPALALALSSCGALGKVFKRKEGCPTNGKNVGAEQILSGEAPKKKPRKFRA